MRKIFIFRRFHATLMRKDDFHIRASRRFGYISMLCRDTDRQLHLHKQANRRFLFCISLERSNKIVQIVFRFILLLVPQLS